VAGVGAALALKTLGAEVVVIDEAKEITNSVFNDQLAAGGVALTLGAPNWLGSAPDLLVVSPGVKPTADVVVQAQSAAIPIWGELELAWRLRVDDSTPWLMVSGTNGKTTTTLMAEAMANSEGKRAQAIGNIGVSAVTAVMSPHQPDTYVVEAAAAQMVFATSIIPLASAVLNFAPDHLDYFGDLNRYQQAKSRVYHQTSRAAIYNLEEPVTKRMLDSAELPSKVQRVGVSLATPKPGELGVADGWLVDRAFADEAPLAEVSQVLSAARHNVLNALFAAALVRAAGFSPSAVAHGLTNFEPARHRIALVAKLDGVTYIDDSKATNAHAAETSIKSYPSVVWVAGGLAKGQDFSGLVQEVRNNLRGVVLLGRDQGEIRAALERHAPQVPVGLVSDTKPESMQEVVRLARAMSRSGDVVLLAPACASWDMYRDYQHRGDCFAEAVLSLDSDLPRAS
jgi:UDP-N-acetylmuramoylalanine--D-glutamate ligase